MRDHLSSIFSYLFMSAAFICVISVFAGLIIMLRSIVLDTTIVERQIGYIFLYIFIASLILGPIFLFISTKLEKYGGRLEDV